MRSQAAILEGLGFDTVVFCFAYRMVGDAGSNNLIKWSDNGQSFLGKFQPVLVELDVR